MELALICAQQVVVLFLLMATGTVAVKTGVLKPENKQALSNLLVYLVVPAMIINSYRMEFSAEILRNLLARPWRFNELLKSIPGLSQKVLTDNLRAMEKDGIITRTVYPEVPPRVEYALSELGESMRPIIKALEVWGTDYQELVRNA